MDTMLFKAFAASLPIGLLLIGSLITCSRGINASSILQVAGAACLMVVVIAHLCEALHVFPWMRWGEENSAGHYLNVTGVALGISLFPLGYLLQAVGRASPRLP